MHAPCRKVAARPNRPHRHAAAVPTAVATTSGPFAPRAEIVRATWRYSPGPRPDPPGSYETPAAFASHRLPCVTIVHREERRGSEARNPDPRRESPPCSHDRAPGDARRHEPAHHSPGD